MKKPRTGHIMLRLTPRQARIVYNTIDGQADVGACEGGNTAEETRVFEAVTMKLLAQHDKWKRVK